MKSLRVVRRYPQTIEASADHGVQIRIPNNPAGLAWAASGFGLAVARAPPPGIGGRLQFPPF